VEKRPEELSAFTKYICANRNLTFASSPCHLGGVDSGLPAVQEKRTNFRKRVLKTAHIILSDKAPKLDCSVRNLSAAGACLQLSTTYGIPMSFDVVLDGVRRPCRAVWRTDTKMGVTFI
jgi:PilZ domain-containing protein